MSPDFVPIGDLAAEYGIKRKSIRQAARRHPVVKAAITNTPDGVMVDRRAFAAWWDEDRDAHMDAVRRGIGG